MRRSRVRRSERRGQPAAHRRVGVRERPEAVVERMRQHLGLGQADDLAGRDRHPVQAEALRSTRKSRNAAYFSLRLKYLRACDESSPTRASAPPARPRSAHARADGYGAKRVELSADLRFERGGREDRRDLDSDLSRSAWHQASARSSPSCSERVRGRLPLPKALRDELGPLLLASAVQHLEVRGVGSKVDAGGSGIQPGVAI